MESIPPPRRRLPSPPPAPERSRWPSFAQSSTLSETAAPEPGLLVFLSLRLYLLLTNAAIRVYPITEL
ncbi:hypothetical protein ZWY2020_001638 [Hordeum vulgare]|nr:hypothetical protein ZWY2020_001638 [Hordeum vulgare]